MACNSCYKTGFVCSAFSVYFCQSQPLHEAVVETMELYFYFKRFAQSAGPWFLVSFVSVVGVVFFVAVPVVLGVFLTI